ncbi:MAG: hypothetical protein FWF81_10055 [Defluviitaleaceae bacterium]|nr:hypothetical protein [Defluviitaleaceae bacterium]
MKMYIRATIKWELRKYMYRVGISIGFLLGSWAVLLLMPVPSDSWFAIFDAIAFILIFTAGVTAVLVGIYMVLIHPYYAAFGDFHKASLIEHQTSRTYSYKLCARILLNIFTYFIGLGSIWVTMALLQRFEAWADSDWFSGMLVDSTAFLIPMVFVFALGVPLVLLIGVNFLESALSGRGSNLDSLDVMLLLFISRLQSSQLYLYLGIWTDTQRFRYEVAGYDNLLSTSDFILSKQLFSKRHSSLLEQL